MHLRIEWISRLKFMCIHDISQNLFQAENFVTQNWWEVQSKNYIILNSYPTPFSGHNKTINRYLKRKVQNLS